MQQTMQDIKGKMYASVVIQGNHSTDANTRTQGEASNLSFRDGGISQNRFYTNETGVKITAYGEDNLHPLRLKLIQTQSLQHSNIISIASNLIAGKMKFNVKDSKTTSRANIRRAEECEAFYKAANIINTHAERAYVLYAYGGVPVLMNTTIGSRNNEFVVGHRNMTDFRFGVHQNTFFGLTPQHHYYHYDWTKVGSNNLSGLKEKTAKAYFKSKKLDNTTILKVRRYNERAGTAQYRGRAGMYSHLIGMPKKTNLFYPKPFFENEVFYQKVYGERELAILERESVRNGLRTDFIITKYRKVYDNPIGESTAEAQKKIDLEQIKKDYVGFKNAGRIHVNFMGINYEDVARKTDGHLEVTPIPNNNNFPEIKGRQESIDKYIRSAHALTVPELAGLNDSKTGFSNLAEYLLYGSELYMNNVIVPHQEKIGDWMNDIVNPINGFEDVEVTISTQVAAIRALVSMFKEYMTVDEVRKDVLGKSALEDGTGNVFRTNSGNNTTKVTTKSLDLETINKIAEATAMRVNLK